VYERSGESVGSLKKSSQEPERQREKDKIILSDLTEQMSSYIHEEQVPTSVSLQGW